MREEKSSTGTTLAAAGAGNSNDGACHAPRTLLERLVGGQEAGQQAAGGSDDAADPVLRNPPFGGPR